MQLRNSSKLGNWELPRIEDQRFAPYLAHLKCEIVRARGGRPVKKEQVVKDQDVVGFCRACDHVPPRVDPPRGGRQDGDEFFRACEVLPWTVKLKVFG